MILRRIGHKGKIADEIQKYYPPHSVYIEMFFGAGGMFFNKPKANHNFLNDLDSDVFNLFQVVSNRKDEFIELFDKMPVCNDLFDYWVTNIETDPIRKAIRFIMLSNFSLYGKGNTLRLGCVKPKEQVYKYIDKTFNLIQNVQFTNCDFRKMLGSISLHEDKLDSVFIYADPPYLQTGNNYSSSFKESDVIDLFNILINSGYRFAYSEFNHPFIIHQAELRGLNIEYIGERISIKNRSIEILVTNYKHKLSLFA